MSSRQLRKLQQQRELEEAARRAEEEAEEEEEEEAPRTPPKSKASLFANLAALEENEDDADEEKDDNVHEVLSEHDSSPKPAAKAKKPKKKKKAKNKGKEKPIDKKEAASDDIDAALKELSLQNPKGESWHNSKPSFDPQYERICELVRIQTQHLKVGNEMRNLFGKAAIENHEDAGGPVGRGARRQGAARQPVDLETALKGHHAPGKGLPEITLRRNIFIQGKDDWPKGTTGGLTMEIVDDLRQENGTVEFRFVHGKAYQAVEQTFRNAVEMFDPQRLIALLVQNPYHISSLLQVSKIAKDQGDHSLSNDLLERALFTFGRASLSLFHTKLAEGKARLDFARPENRELWLAGYHYIKSLVMKGTYRTAFEWAKLLLNLSPEEDPYCMRLMLHQLALRAHEFNWLLDLGEFIAGQEALPEEERIAHHGPCWTDSYWTYHNTPSLALASLQLKEGVTARDLLSKSMRRLPWLFARLFSDLNLDTPPSVWGSQPRSDAEDLFTSLYIQQTKDLWNTTEGTALLMEIAHTIPKPRYEDIPVVSNSEMDLDVVRFIYLDATTSLMALVPSDLLHRGNNSDADPIPPDHSIYSYHIEDPRLRLPRSALARGPGGGFNGPMAAAIGQMLFNRRDGDADDSGDDEAFADILRNGVGELGPESGEEDEEDEAEDEGQPPTMVRRLLDYLWNGPRISWEDDGDDPEEESMTEDGDDDDDDDQMPDLIPFDQADRRHENHEDTDDEMPELV